MLPEGPPSAEGDLSETPFAHLVVYALDRQVTGEVFLAHGEDEAHVIRFEAGIPTKIQVADGFARLGDLLVERGAISRELVESAVLTGGLLGDVLVLSGHVEPEVVDELVVDQFRKRFVKFFSLPGETAYTYFEGSDSLEHWGGDPSRLDPFALLWAGIEANGHASTMLGSTLDLLGDLPLRLHELAPVDRFGMSPEAQAIVDHLRETPVSLADLRAAALAPEELVERVVYVLAICRHFDVGRPGLPVGVRAARTRHLAKVQLKSQLHVVGAAVDSPAAGGESSRRHITMRGLIPRGDDEAAHPGPIRLDMDGPAIEVDEELEDLDELEAAERELDAEADGPVSGVAEVPAAAPAGAATGLDDGQASEDSTRRILSDAVRGLALEALMKLALERIDEKDPAGACEVCDIAMQRLEEGAKVEPVLARQVKAIAAWSRALMPGANLKGLALELDELVSEADDSAWPRWARGVVRKRLGDNGGAASDFRRVLELAPGYEWAKQELDALERPAGKAAQPGFLKKLFGR